MGSFLLIFLSFFLLLLFHFPSHSSSLVPLCSHDESSVLVRFKNSFSLNRSVSDFIGCYSSYPKTASWENGTDCCRWDGVTCDIKSGHVIGLDLSCSWLQGEFNPNSTLFHLTHLQTLNLAFNDFSKSPIFSGFGDIVTLTYLNLSSSGFGGVIPSKISHLSKLVSLDLSLNILRFDPSTWKKLILNATDLRGLYLEGVNMSSIMPSSLSLLMNLSSSLTTLSLRGTELQGNLANNIFCLPNLQKLDLSLNSNLKGQLPKSNWSSSLLYLDLSQTAFSGEVPDSIGHLKSLNHLDLSYCYFGGLIPPSLWNLTQLTYLRLRSNNFRGEISSSLSNLQHLTTLDLSHCNFEGPIPLSLGNLTQLTFLRLGSNNISGEIPSSLSNLQHLTILDLSNCRLGGQLPSFLFDLTELSVLDCSSNKLVGPIPSKIGRLSNLTYLILSNNLLNGTIPQACFSLPSLEYVFLDGNKLQGNIPMSMFDLINLTDLSLSSNNLSGFVDFHQFSKLHNLLYLDLSDNNFLSLSFESSVDYTIPNLGYLYLSSCNINSFPKFLANLQYLEHLDISNNKIHGRIPKWFDEHLALSWKNIEFVDLSSNMLQGDLPIPPFGIGFFSVSKNNLTGDISSAICNASSLGILNLSHNNLTGMIPQCLGTFPDLWVLDLQMNNLYGVIPRNFSHKNGLQTIKFNGNQLEGPLPRSLAHCKQLEVLDLGGNNIEDTFPNWLQPLQELQVLILRSNKFHGVITRLKTKHTFPMLRIFDVSNNYFSGPLPTEYIKDFREMMNVEDGRITGLIYMQSYSEFKSYNDSVVVTMKGYSIELVRILTTFTTIDLSNNMFGGQIPAIIGQLNSLKGLNLSHNRITGAIPQSLGSLTNLEWLDLSSNKLMGEIPIALTNLCYLSFLNLSQNHLEGIIPSGKQFNTFQNDSYEGNPGLCGLPLSKSCIKDEEQPPESTTIQHEEQFGFGWKAVAVGYACGVVFGMLLGCIVFSTRKPQCLMRLLMKVYRMNW